MKLTSRVKSLEASTAGQSLCTVTYKRGKGPDEPARMPLDKALQEARTGRVKRIDFPLTFNEEQAERLCSKHDLASRITEAISGVRRDEGEPSAGNLIFCTRPIVFARQAPPVGGVGGQLVTEDGTPFHQSQWQEVLAQHHAGFLIVRDYDEAQEPWYNERN